MTEHRTTCKDCGEYLEGDGFKRVIHCPNLEEISYEEPDAGPIYCGWDEGWIDDLSPQPAPDVQGEPVVYLRKDQLRQVQRMGPMLGEIADSPRVDRVPVYTAPQPATEAALLEAFVAETAAQAEAAELAGALDEMIKAADVASWGGYFPTDAVTRAVEALAAYRNQGGEL